MQTLCNVEVQQENRIVKPVIQPSTSVEETQKTASFLRQLRPFLSAAAWQHLIQGGLDSSTESFEATIFVADLVNSSQLLSRNGSERSGKEEPEAVARHLQKVAEYWNRFLTLIQDNIHEHGGFTEKLLGDGLLAVFPSAQAGLRAAQASQRALAKLNARQMTAGDPPLFARIALDSGPIIITSLGGRWRMDHTVIGVAVNGASALAHFTRPGEIWFTQATRDRLEDTRILTEASLVRLKGYSLSQTVYRLVRSFAEDL